MASVALLKLPPDEDHARAKAGYQLLLLLLLRMAALLARTLSWFSFMPWQWHCPHQRHTTSSGLAPDGAPSMIFRVLAGLALWIHETFGTDDHWMSTFGTGGVPFHVSESEAAGARTAGGR